MKEQLIQYVELLFAGADDCQEIKQEILQNTLDRYDDLIAQGMVPEAAYRMAIAGIGDINEILGAPREAYRQPGGSRQEPEDPQRRKLRAIAIALYILCPLPTILAGEFGDAALGVCGLLVFVAVATALMVMTGRKESQEPVEPSGSPRTQPRTAPPAEPSDEPKGPQSKLKQSLGSVIWAVGLALYFILSFTTGAWHITWVVFPLTWALQGLENAIVDILEEKNYET